MVAIGAAAAGLVTQVTPTNATSHLLNVIDSSGSTVFLHLNKHQAEATIFALCYYSLWFGALGWDIVSTLPFDFVLLRETRWSSAPSVMHSFAYLASRYFTLAWIGLSTWNIATVSQSCDARMVAGSVLFGVSFSATGLIFVLRTIAIWQLNWKVVVVLGLGWLNVLGWAISIPFTVTASNLPDSSFCEYSMGDTKFFGVWSAVILVDLLCLGLTIAKLNKTGLRTILSGLLPQLSTSVDSEKITVVVVQRTTAFFLVRFVVLLSCVIVYATTEGLNYQLAQIIACVAMSASMAGRLFRKAWRMTRARNDGNVPPVYCSGWAEALGHDPAAAAEAARKERMGGVGDVPGTARSPKELELFDEDHYVEGEFTSRSATSLRLRRPSILTVRGEARTGSIAERYAQAHRELAMARGGEGSQIELADAQSRNRLRTPPSRGGRSDSTSPSPFHSEIELGTVEPAPASEDPPDTIVHIGHHAVTVGEHRPTSLFGDGEPAVSRSPSQKRPTTGDSVSGRDDLNPLPTFSRLWLDSSAARQRREQHGDTHTIASSAGSAGSSSRRKTARTSILEGMDGAEKRIIDVGQSKARKVASKDSVRRNANGVDSGDQAADDTEGLAYVASPAIMTTPTLSSRSDRWTYDVDALKTAVSVTLDMDGGKPGSRTPEMRTPGLLSAGPSSPTKMQFPQPPPPAVYSPTAPSFLQTQPSNASLGGLAMTSTKSPGKARPRTAPDATPHSRSRQLQQSSEGDDEAHLLSAFRRAVEDDIEEHHRHGRSNSLLLGSPFEADGAEGGRPRTARGTPSSAWERRASAPKEDTLAAAAAAAAMNGAVLEGRRPSFPSSRRHQGGSRTATPPRSRDRPTTSNGSSVKPFGAGCPGFDASSGSVLRRKASSRLNAAEGGASESTATVAPREPTIEALFHSLEDAARRDSADFGKSADTTLDDAEADATSMSEDGEHGRPGRARLERIESAGEREADGVERLR